MNESFFIPMFSNSNKEFIMHVEIRQPFSDLPTIIPNQSNQINQEQRAHTDSITAGTASQLSENDIKKALFNKIKSGKENELNEYLTSFDILQKTKYLSSSMRFVTQWAAGGVEEMKPLQYACFLGNIDAVRVLLKHGASGNDFGDTSDSTQRGSLHFALDANQPQIALLLLEKGVKDEVASCQASHGSSEYQVPKEWGGSNWACLSALHMAIIKNMNEVVERLLSTGAANISEKASGINSCLHLAARSGNEGIIKVLLSFGAKAVLRIKDQYGRTPQDVAIANGHTHLLELLS